MAKQEEIREGVLKLTTLRGDVEAIIGSWFLDHKEISKLAPLATKAIFKHLHSQDVVLKVERELPVCFGDFRTVKNRRESDYATGFHDCKDAMLKAGYEAVEPLIGGGI